MATMTTASSPTVGTNSSFGAKTMTSSSSPLIRRPWYAKGGMIINSIGMAFNIFVPVVFLVSFLSPGQRKQFLGFLLLCYTSAIVTGRTTVYCILVIPTFLASLTLAWSIVDPEEDEFTVDASSNSTFYGQSVRWLLAMALIAVSIVGAICKVNICMSVCLHRYASHAAFKCGPITQLFLAVTGCLANQGGPIWWASQHISHHKHCDIPGDPHSPAVSGTEQAFGFFQIHDQVLEEFAPLHMENFAMRLIDTWAFVFVTTEMILSHHFMGRMGLFITYTSGWLCQAITLWFNIANHPPPSSAIKDDSSASSSSGNNKLSFHAKCNATDIDKINPWKDPCLIGGGVYLPFVFLDALTPLFAFFVRERAHAHHHEHPRLAQRTSQDIAYWGFVYPLQRTGLVWNVVSLVPEKENGMTTDQKAK